MKKGCLILLGVVAVLLLLLLIAVMVGYRIANERFGVSLAPAISHEAFADGDTRIRLLIKPEMATSHIEAYLPEDVDIPTAGFSVADVINHVLPREIALLARTDVPAGKVRLTVFMNEKRGGPLIAVGVREANVFANMPQVNWTTDGLELRERGTLIAEGDIPLPDAVESELLEIWPTRAQEPPVAARGDHLVELVVDNRNGDILAFAAAAATAAGEDWEKMRAEDMADMVVNIIESIFQARLTADMADMDTVALTLRIDMDEKSGPGLQFLVSGLAMPWVRDTLRDNHNLEIEGQLRWDEDESAIIGEYTISGIESFMREALDEAA